MMPSRWIVLGLSVALAVILGAWRVEVANMRADHAVAIKAEQDKTAAQKTLYDDLVVASANNVAAAANGRAQELNEALDEQSRLQAENDRLRASYAATSKERDTLSRELLRRLNDAPKTPESFLDAGTREYYRGLRQRQRADDGPDHPTPPGDPD